MATVAAPVRRSISPDRIFFPAMCLLILVVVWLGFAKTYYAIGMISSHQPSAVVHVHAVIFTLWLVTLVVQTGLVSARKVAVHRKLGLWGFALTIVMFVIALVAATEALRRDFSPPGSGLDARVFYVIPVSDMVLFAAFILWAWRGRNRPAEHKRMILLATIAIAEAAVDRFPFNLTPMSQPVVMGLYLSLLLPLIVYDLATLRRLNRATLIGSLAIVVAMFIRIPIAMSHPWLAFASFMKGS